MTRTSRSPARANAASVAACSRPEAQLLLLEWERRFLTRRQPFARQQEDGSYRWVFQRLDRLALLAHLQGKETLALASRDELDQCRWVCIDADAPDGLDQLRLVQRALEKHGLPSLVEQSRRGGHLWLFFSLPLPVSLATGVVQGVLEPLYDSRHLPSVLEVYPDHTELGHALRMPLGIHHRTGQRYPFLDHSGAAVDLADLSTAMSFALAQPAIRPEQLRAIAATMGTIDDPSRRSPHTRLASSVTAHSSTTSAVMRWVDAQVNLLDLLEELAPATDMRLAGQGYLGWCPFHDDHATDAHGDPSTPSFYVVYNARYGWSWRCLSTNCMHSDGPMRHSFRLFQELLQLAVVSAIGAALARWPEAGAPDVRTRKDEADADDPPPNR